MTDFKSHIGMTRERHDQIREWPVAALAATLEDGLPEAGLGDPLPPLRHWLHFLPVDPLSKAGGDGHARTGDFLPDTGLPRRMWAGGRITFHRDLPIGQRATCISRIDDISEKSGRSGKLVFVRVVHEISGEGGLAITEEQDLVYREAPRIGGAAANHDEAPSDAAWSRTVEPDPILLFRYSALTFNSHRIHYDHPYVTGVEGYDGPVVHGPVLATFMADLACLNNPGRRLAWFSFRGAAPVICGEPFDVSGRPEGGEAASLWIAQSGNLAMRGEARFEEKK